MKISAAFSVLASAVAAAMALSAAAAAAAAAAPAVPAFELVREGRLTAEARAIAPGAVALTLRSRRGELSVAVPAGTRFGAPGKANLIATRAVTVVVSRTATVIVNVPVASTNLHMPRPDRKTPLKMSPPGSKTIALLNRAREAKAAPAVTQAAILVVTENAPFEALRDWDSGTPKIKIREREAVEAMMLLEKSGVPLKGKALWDQRVQLARAVIFAPAPPPPDVARWCEKIVVDHATDAGSNPNPDAEAGPAALIPVVI
jgi:hypothetical protein